MQPEVSLIIPVYKAEKTLPLLIPVLVRVMETTGSTYEILLVDDQSPDGSWNLLCDLAACYKQLRIFRLDKNYGQLAATTCGLQQAYGKVLVTMDDDLQFSPEEIPAMMNYYLQHNYQLVFGIAQKKINSKSLDYTRTVMRFLFKYIFLRRYSAVEYFSSFRIMNAAVIKTQRLRNLFMIWQLAPKEIGNFPVNHFPTSKQLTSYTFFKRVKHFSPYIFLALRKTGLVFGVVALLVAFLLFWQNAGVVYWMVTVLGSVLSFVTGGYFFQRLKKMEHVGYAIQSKQ